MKVTAVTYNNVFHGISYRASKSVSYGSVMIRSVCTPFTFLLLSVAEHRFINLRCLSRHDSFSRLTESSPWSCLCLCLKQLSHRVYEADGGVPISCSHPDRGAIVAAPEVFIQH
eukprot:1817168-Amphidinium_carterae.1